MSAGDPSEFERGKEAGRIEQRLDGFDKHFASLNGSIAETAGELSGVKGELREIREDLRLREERVITAAETLAAETERRRVELADTKDAADDEAADVRWKFSRRERLFGLAVAIGGLALATKDFWLS